MTGESEVSSYQAGEAVGEGVRWSADGKSAWRLHDGEARTFLIWQSYMASKGTDVTIGIDTEAM